jgi:7,8-dihydropterin-6-yl-methyl-4-(beta-D-ribofuranosyl)aminobenzene 5'-phosphate synthase
MIITVLFENHAGFKKGLLGAHGFSVLVQHNGKKILVDTGSDGRVLLHNMEALNVSPEEVEALFLTHGHYDHTGGLKEFLDARKSSIDVYAHPDIFLRRIALKPKRREIGIPFSQEYLERLGANFILREESTKIFEGMYTSGEIERTTWDRAVGYLVEGKKLVKDPIRDDMALILDIGSSMVIVTGCGHSGILNIAMHAKSTFYKPIFALVGGLHLRGAKRHILEDVVKGFKDFGIKKLYPGHCTGIDEYAYLKAEIGSVEALHVGKVMKM